MANKNHAGVNMFLFKSYRDRVTALELENIQLKETLKNKNDIIVCLEVDKKRLWQDRERADEGRALWYRKYSRLHAAHKVVVRTKRRKKPLGKSVPRKCK